MATIKTAELAKMAKAVQPGLADKALVPGMTRIQFDGEHIMTYNGSVCVTFPMKTGFQCSVSASEFIKIANKLKQEETEMEFNKDSHELAISSGRISAQFSTEAVNDIKDIIKNIRGEIPENNSKEWIELSPQFVESVQLTTPAASRNKQKGAACLLHCREEYVMCADNTKFAIYYIDTPGVFMVDAMEITSLLNTGARHCFFTEVWTHFKSEDNIVTSIRKRAGEFQYTRFESLIQNFPEDAMCIDIPSDFKNAIDTASTFSEDEGKIMVEISKGAMTCKGKSLHGKAEYAIDFNYDGEAFEFPINLAWIQHILDKTQTMWVDTKSERVEFAVGDYYIYLVSMKRRKK